MSDHPDPSPAKLDLSQYKVIVVVFGQEGCPACEAYVPQLQARVEQLRAQAQPLWLYDPEQPTPPNVVVVLVYDLAGGDPELQKFADRYKIGGLPTTLVLRSDGGVFRLEGVLATGHIDQMLLTAVQQL